MSGIIGQIGSKSGTVDDSSIGEQTQENLLTNSGFDVWSNSTLEIVTALITGDSVDMDTIPAYGDVSSWFGGQSGITTSVAGGVSGNALKVLNNYGSPNGVTASITVAALVIGKLYKIQFSIKNDGSMGEDLSVRMSGSSNQWLWYSSGINPALSLTSSYVTHSLVFEATAANTQLDVATIGNQGSGEFWLMDNFTLDEVTPGCVANDNKAPDTWGKDTSGMDMWREHNGTNTKAGSHYALKITGDSDSFHCHQPLPYVAPANSASWYEKFKGRTVTLGCWIKTSTASKAKLVISDGVGSTSSATHSGGGSYEWIEITRDVSASATAFWITLLAGASNTAYFSQPMLVFGKSMGSGNYTRPKGEVVDCETNVRFVSGTAQAAADDKILNLETLSDGKIPKGCKSVYVEVQVMNTSVTSDQGIQFGPNSSTNGMLRAHPHVSNVWHQAAGWINCDDNGDIYQLNKEADATISALYVDAHKIELH